MNDLTDLRPDLTYVIKNGNVIWHIARIAIGTVSRPDTVALCGRQAHWSGECQGSWIVTKLCRQCRARAEVILAKR